jgi:hypothetical protein
VRGPKGGGPGPVLAGAVLVLHLPRVVEGVEGGVSDEEWQRPGPHAPRDLPGDVGVATDVAIESAGIVLAVQRPRGVMAVIWRSQASYRRCCRTWAGRAATACWLCRLRQARWPGPTSP